jgi:hypothetical protein
MPEDGLTMTIVLNRYQIRRGCEVGVMRRAMHFVAEHEKKKRPDRNDQRQGKETCPWNAVVAAVAEYAVSIVIEGHWVGDYWSKTKTVDILPDIEVRWTCHEDGCLLVYDDDDPNSRYVLVRGKIPCFEIIGWIHGYDAMKEEYRGKLPGRDDRPEMYRVPDEALHAIEELVVHP